MELTDRKAVAHGVMRDCQPDLVARRILVVEDEYLIARDLCVTLSSRGARVLGPAPSVTRARKLLHEAAPDCVLLDIHLSDGHAFELAAELRRAAIQTIFITGYDFAYIPPELNSIVCLQKPVDIAVLLRCIASGAPPNYS